MSEFNCDALPRIPEWADKGNPTLQHVLCGMVDPTKILSAYVIDDGETDGIEGEEFIIRAQRISGPLVALNACGFDFCVCPENWGYLPRDATVLIFPNTIFLDSYGAHRVWSLRSDKKRWLAYYELLEPGVKFSRAYKAAVALVGYKRKPGKFC